MSDRLIGRTTGFGPVNLGSSPGRTTSYKNYSLSLSKKNAHHLSGLVCAGILFSALGSLRIEINSSLLRLAVIEPGVIINTSSSGFLRSNLCFASLS